MAAPMVSGNPFLVRPGFVLAFTPCHINSCLFHLTSDLVSISLRCRAPLRPRSIQQGAPPPTPSYSAPSNQLLRRVYDKLALLHVLICLISPSSFKEKRQRKKSETHEVDRCGRSLCGTCELAPTEPHVIKLAELLSYCGGRMAPPSMLQFRLLLFYQFSSLSVFFLYYAGFPSD